MSLPSYSVRLMLRALFAPGARQHPVRPCTASRVACTMASNDF